MVDKKMYVMIIFWFIQYGELKKQMKMMTEELEQKNELIMQAK